MRQNGELYEATLKILDKNKQPDIRFPEVPKVKTDIPVLKNEIVALENRLKEYRARLGINQADMGKLAGVSRQTISLIERGDYSPSVTLALKLAKICRVTVEDIFIYAEDEEDE